ncbi:hypothetical protein C8F01DRAFT_1095509 [Mycena amicta]|nr:hypothetical protein C8F01DRAFT_1095509 [Mycena amicta]
MPSSSGPFSNFPSPWTSTHIDRDGWERRVDSATWLGGLGDAQGYIVRVHMWPSVRRANTSNKGCWTEEWCYDSSSSHVDTETQRNTRPGQQTGHTGGNSRDISGDDTVQSVRRCRERPSYITNVKRGYRHSGSTRR